MIDAVCACCRVCVRVCVLCCVWYVSVLSVVWVCGVYVVCAVSAAAPPGDVSTLTRPGPQ